MDRLLIPQIIEIKYRRGSDNSGPDYLTRYTTIEEDHHPQSLSAITRSMTNKNIPSSSTPLTAHGPSTPTSSPTSTAILDLTFERIKLAQSEDVSVQNIIKATHEQKENENFVVVDGILFRLIIKRNNGMKSKVPYIPASMISRVLEAFHDHPMSGHFGIKRTFLKLRTRFWWPNMRASITDYIASCQQCATHNIVRNKTPGHLKCFEQPSDQTLEVSTILSTIRT